MVGAEQLLTSAFQQLNAPHLRPCLIRTCQPSLAFLKYDLANAPRKIRKTYLQINVQDALKVDETADKNETPPTRKVVRFDEKYDSDESTTTASDDESNSDNSSDYSTESSSDPDNQQTNARGVSAKRRKKRKKSARQESQAKPGDSVNTVQQQPTVIRKTLQTFAPPTSVSHGEREHSFDDEDDDNEIRSVLNNRQPLVVGMVLVSISSASRRRYGASEYIVSLSSSVSC